VAIVVAPGSALNEASVVHDALAGQGVACHYVAESLGPVPGDGGGSIVTTKTLASTPSVMFDGVYVPGGRKGIESLRSGAAAMQFLREAHSHYKPMAATGEGVELLNAAVGQSVGNQPASAEGSAMAGVVTGDDAEDVAGQFIVALGKHRHWDRDVTQQVSSSVRP
jgi:catalase